MLQPQTAVLVISMKRAMGFSNNACEHVCLFMLTCVFFMFVKVVPSWTVGVLLESVAVKKIPRIHSEKRLASCSAEGATHDIIHTHPVSLWPRCRALPLPLIPHRAVPVCVCVYVCIISGCVFLRAGKAFFSHLLWLTSKTLQPWGSHPPTQPLPALPVSQTTLAPTDRALCVILTCFLSTGAPNSTSGPPWITNAPSVGPQTAHCLSYAVFSLRVLAWAAHWEFE